MSRISFFYDIPSVYKVTLRALERRDFVILEADAKTGIIKAETRKGVLKPKIKMEVRLNLITENQTSLDISSKIKKNWLTPEGYEAKLENKFINTLYKCFENI